MAEAFGKATEEGEDALFAGVAAAEVMFATKLMKADVSGSDISKFNTAEGTTTKRVWDEEDAKERQAASTKREQRRRSGGLGHVRSGGLVGFPFLE